MITIGVINAWPPETLRDYLGHQDISKPCEKDTTLREPPIPHWTSHEAGVWGRSPRSREVVFHGTHRQAAPVNWWLACSEKPQAALYVRLEKCIVPVIAMLVPHQVNCFEQKLQLPCIIAPPHSFLEIFHHQFIHQVHLLNCPLSTLWHLAILLCHMRRSLQKQCSV